MQNSDRIFFLAAAGGTASGKTTFAHLLHDHLAQLGYRVAILGLDSYYLDRSHLPLEERGNFNYDHPSAFDIQLLERQLIELKKGKTIEVPKYDYSTHSRTSEKTIVSPPQVLIFEGILVYSWEEIRNLFDFRIFIDAPADLRLARRIKRDIKERGRSEESVIEQWNSSVQPMHAEFCEPTKLHAHEVISGEVFSENMFENIILSLKEGK